MNKNILVLLFFIGLPAQAMEFVSIDAVKETVVENIQQQAPMTSLLQTMQRLYAADTTNKSIAATNFVDSKREKTYLGIRAPVPDKLMNRYLGWQSEGELLKMQNELQRLEGKISQRSRVSFKRFKWERRKSFLNKVISNEITQNLSIVNHGTLEQAEAMVQLLENPPVAQFADDAYIAMKREERILARQILEKRTDYRNKIQQQQQKASQVSYTTHSTQATVESSTTFSSGIYVDNEQVLNTAVDEQTVYDLKLTTPTDVDSQISPQLAQIVENSMREIMDPAQVEFAQYSKIIESNIVRMEQASLLKLSEYKSKSNLAHGFRHFFVSLVPNNPLNNPKEFALNAVKYTGLAAIHIMTEGALLEAQMAASVVMNAQKLMNLDTQKMTGEQIAEAVAEELADTAYCIATAKVAPKASQDLVKLGSNILRRGNPTTLEQAVLKTAEGAEFKVPHAELTQNTNVLQNAAEIRPSYKPLWYEELTFKPLGLGSTGRSAPANLNEQLVLKDIMLNPIKGDIIKLPNGMADIRWPKEHGWVKMRYYNRDFDIDIHYVGRWENGILKAVDDFKFKEYIR